MLATVLVGDDPDVDGVLVQHPLPRQVDERAVFDAVDPDKDVVVAAIGRPGLVCGKWIKQGAVVVDAGYADGTGDVEYAAAADRASFITPVPGGVGPMTVATVLAQTLHAARTRFTASAPCGRSRG